MSFTMLWILWTRFTLKCPSQRHWSSSAPYFLMIVSNWPYPLYGPCWSSFRTNCHYVVLLKSTLHLDLSQYIHLGWVSLSTHLTQSFSLKANLLATWTYGGGHPWYKFLDFIFHHHLNNNKTHYDCFHNAIITHIDITWSNYLIYTIYQMPSYMKLYGSMLPNSRFICTSPSNVVHVALQMHSHHHLWYCLFSLLVYLFHTKTSWCSPVCESRIPWC